MSDESLDLLRRIAVAVERLAANLPPDVADSAAMDGPYGDPVIKFTPRDWTGEPTNGLRLSECHPGALDLLAKAYDYFAQKNEAEGKLSTAGKPVAPYDRKNAALCRGWAQRKRSGWTRPSFSGGDDESAF